MNNGLNLLELQSILDDHHYPFLKIPFIVAICQQQKPQCFSILRKICAMESFVHFSKLNEDNGSYW